MFSFRCQLKKINSRLMVFVRPGCLSWLLHNWPMLSPEYGPVEKTAVLLVTVNTPTHINNSRKMASLTSFLRCVIAAEPHHGHCRSASGQALHPTFATDELKKVCRCPISSPIQKSCITGDVFTYLQDSCTRSAPVGQHMFRCVDRGRKRIH